MTKKEEKNAAKKAKREGLKVWSETVRNHDGHRCIVCGCRPHKITTRRYSKKIKRWRLHVRYGGLDAHHLLDRVNYPEQRTDPRNGVTLCPQHHKWATFSAHRNPFWFVHWIRAHRPVQYNYVMAHVGEE